MNNRNAFTLLETLIVILIMGILASVAVPSYFGSLQEYRADLAQQQLVADLKLASTLAKSQSSNQKIVFTTDHETEGSNYYFEDYADPFKKQNNKQTNLDQSPYFSTMKSNTSEVTFDIYGLPLGGGLWIINKDTPYERVVQLRYPGGEIRTQ